MRKVLSSYKKIWITAVGVLMLFSAGCGIAEANQTTQYSIPGSELPFASVSIVPIAAGNAHSMAITEDGRLLVWGDNRHGILGDGTTTRRYNPTEIMEAVSAVSANVGEITWSDSVTHNVALATDGTLWVWGSDIREAGILSQSASTHGSFGRPYRWLNNLHTPVKIMENVTSISAGGGHAMAITSDNTLWSWGFGSHGQRGVGSGDQPIDQPTIMMEDVIFVSAGGRFTMIITSDGTLWSRGSNGSGQLGDGTNEQRQAFNQEPHKVMEYVIYVSAGETHAMAITSDNVLWGWGNNRNGRLGDGTTTERHSPTKIMEDVIYVSAGVWHTMAITSDGVLWGWGNNANGQLGDGTTEERRSPIKIMDDVVAVAVGGSHTLAVTSDGTLWAWGSNRNGQLGDGTTENRLYPTRIMDGVRIDMAR